MLFKHEQKKQLYADFSLFSFPFRLFVIVKNENNANKARYHFFTNRSRFPGPSILPPSRDTLYHCFNGVNFQSRECKSAPISQQQYSEPIRHGWTRINDGSLEINWINKRPDPDSILEFTSCNSRRSKCITGVCKCKDSNICCTDFRGCLGCENA